MSRSYKFRKTGKIVFFKESNSKFGKKSASSAVRRAEDVPNGKAYKKFFCSYDICDYRWSEPKYNAYEFRLKWESRDDNLFTCFSYCHNWKKAYRKYLKLYIIK
ncbi:MAG: hypothetical protein K2J47_01355 [Ruminococcus sp.]|nr:hypothetical protein [Ruminococcus sp.]MDE6787954.1 hypothetical protein [Ruminococcus sp.]